MRVLIAFLLLASVAIADGPSIVGPKSVKVGQPPWVSLSVDGAEAGSVTRWSGAIGPGLAGMESKDGVAVSTAVPGRYAFRCIVQTPKDGIDPIVVLDAVLVVEGDGVVPVPDVVPTVDWQQRLTAAVKAAPDKHAGFVKVAGVYGLVADQIKSGLLTSPEQVTKMTTLLCGAASPEWAAIDAAIVQPHLKTLTLKLSDYEPLWRQIQSAIKAGLTDIPPPPDVVPIPTTGLHVLMVWESSQPGEIPESQVQVLTSTIVRDWIREHNGQFRVFDDDTDLSQTPKVWQDAMKVPRQSLPWIVVSNGRTGFSGPLPKNIDDTIKLLEQHK
ncbi:MAG: hypothetical protein E6Q97_32075 [Desulfurellales bacterium]|nr:MAG: hypothetical protein E6Q97_32075 [Desulfurellales bacterium]